MALVAPTAACADLSSLSSANDGADASDGAAEASGAADATALGDADAGLTAVDAALPDANDAGGLNLLQNGDFELGCAGWEASFGSFTESPQAYAGTTACRFCMDTNWEAFFTQSVNVPVQAGESYYAEIWVQAASSLGSLADAGLVGQELLLSTPAKDQSSASNQPVAAQWGRITTLLKTTQAAKSLTLDYRLQQQGNPADKGGVICVLLDNAVLRRL
jgi:hypothetical protein